MLVFATKMENPISLDFTQEAGSGGLQDARLWMDPRVQNAVGTTRSFKILEDTARYYNI